MRYDWRELIVHEDVFRQLRRLVVLPFLLVIGYLVILHYAPDAPATKYITKVVTVRAPVRIIHTPPEPRVRDCVGCMTAQEFASIHPDTEYEGLKALFGEYPGQVDNDRREFYPAVGGGTYWVFLKYGGSCNKNHDNDECINVVSRTAYTP